LQRKTQPACQGNGEAVEHPDALLIQMKMSFWPHLEHQMHKTLMWTGIPSSKMKKMHKRLHDARQDRAAALQDSLQH
jgi:hypothetical protein